MATSTLSPTKHQGGSFLLEPTASDEIFTPEDFTDEHRAIARTTEEFWTKEVAPERRRHPAPGTGPGGLDPAQVRPAGSDRGRDSRKNSAAWRWISRSAMIVAEGISQGRLLFGLARRAGRHRRAAAAAVRHRRAEADVSAEACHRRDGRRLLPQRAAGRLRRAGREHARRSDARRQALHPQRPEDVDHQRRRRRICTPSSPKSAARNSPRSWWSARFPACSPAPKKRRWASRAAPPRPSISTTCKVPVENVLGEIGRGHIIAFNILNLGRLKLGPFAVGGAKEVLRVSLKYAKERKAFGKSIAEFGMIQHKLAEMAIRIYRHRVVQLSRGRPDRERARRTSPGTQPDAAQDHAQGGGGIRRRVLLHQGLRVGNARLRRRRRRPDPRRLRLSSGLPGRARLSRFAHQPDLRRHQRDQPAARHRHAAEARAARPVAAGGSGEETAGRDPGRPVALGLGGDEDSQAGGEREEGRAVRAGRRVSEVHDRARGAAGSAGGRSPTSR